MTSPREQMQRMLTRVVVLSAVAATLAQAPARDPVPRPAGAAVIRGRVVDSVSGRPLRRATVWLSGITTESVSTNSQGTFEFRELPPGRYELRVSRAGYLDAHYGQRRFSEAGRPIDLSAAQRIDDVVIRLVQTSIISGHVIDETGEPIAGVEVLPMQFKYFQGRKRFVLAGGNPLSTDTTGFFRISGLPPGDYQLLAMTRQTWTIEEDGARHVLAYAPTYFPGATSGGGLQHLRVQPGQDAADVMIALVPGRHATITGSAVDSRGRPLAGQTVQAFQEFRGLTQTRILGLPSVPIEADGSFVMRDVAPGEYVLRVAVVHTSRHPAEDSVAPSRMPPPLPERSRVRVSVDGGDIHDMVIRTSPAVSASGRVESDDGVALPESIRSVRILAQPADDVDPDLHPSPESGRIRGDGTFEAGPLFGTYRFTTTPNLPNGWVLKAVLRGLDDTSVVPVEAYGPKPLTGLRVVLTNSTAEVSGRVAGPDGAAADATVLIFSTAREHWFEHSRFVRAVRADVSGRFQISGLLPGEYYAIALEFIEDRQWYDPEYLASLIRASARVMLAPRDRREMTMIVRR